MARDFYINGEAMVTVKGMTGSAIASLQQLGLAADPIQVQPAYMHKDLMIDAFGQVAPDTQFMLASASITMTLLHFDKAILDECMRLSMGGPPIAGQVARAGQRLGNNQPRFGGPTGSPTGYTAGNCLIGLNIAAPVAGAAAGGPGQPWRFLTAYLSQPPVVFPLGTEKSLVRLTWEAIPYAQDPWGSGLGAYGVSIWDNTPDT